MFLRTHYERKILFEWTKRGPDVVSERSFPRKDIWNAIDGASYFRWYEEFYSADFANYDNFKMFAYYLAN